MQYRFELEKEQRAKQAEALQKVQLLAGKAERRLVEEKLRREMMQCRLRMDSKQRVKQAEEFQRASRLMIKAERDLAEVNLRGELMKYRFELKSEQYAKQAEELRKAHLLVEQAERDRAEVNSRRKMMLYRFALESDQNAKQAEVLDRVKPFLKTTIRPSNPIEEDENVAMPQGTLQRNLFSNNRGCLVKKIATALAFSYLGFLYNPRSPPSLFNPESIRIRSQFTFPLYQFELP